MVFSNLISEFSCKTIRGCGKKVSTRLSYLLFAVLSIILSRIFLMPYMDTVKVPVRIVFFVVLKSLIEKNLQLNYFMVTQIYTIYFKM
jgi:heme/copper-type cytochrome/quinol oxidase subunit 4